MWVRERLGDNDATLENQRGPDRRPCGPGRPRLPELLVE